MQFTFRVDDFYMLIFKFESFGAVYSGLTGVIVGPAGSDSIGSTELVHGPSQRGVNIPKTGPIMFLYNICIVTLLGNQLVSAHVAG